MSCSNKQKIAAEATNLNFALMVSHLLHSQVFCSSSYKRKQDIISFKVPPRKKEHNHKEIGFTRHKA